MLSCWEVNLAIFRRLDQQLPFYKNPAKRIRRQIIFGGLATMTTFSIVFPLAIRLYSGAWPLYPTVISGIFVCATIATVVNGAYVGLYLIQTIYLEKQQTTQELTNQLTRLAPAHSEDLLRVEAGNGQWRLRPDEIAYFYSTGGLVLLIKSDGQQLTTAYTSFTKLGDLLPETSFFQLSRQFIVNLNAIRFVQDDVNQKLLVGLMPALHKNDPHERVIVSRYRSAQFKKWFR
ncbi:hypothetical protein GCM10028818_17850 [Spirosoma horti]